MNKTEAFFAGVCTGVLLMAVVIALLLHAARQDAKPAAPVVMPSDYIRLEYDWNAPHLQLA